MESMRHFHERIVYCMMGRCVYSVWDKWVCEKELPMRLRPRACSAEQQSSGGWVRLISFQTREATLSGMYSSPERCREIKSYLTSNGQTYSFCHRCARARRRLFM